MKKMLRVLIVAVFSIFLVSGAALAASITIDFSSNALSGEIYTDGKNAWTVGQGIQMVSVTVSGTGTSADHTYNTNADQAFLTFDTGKASNFIDVATQLYQGIDYLHGLFSSYTVTFPYGKAIKVDGAGSDVKNSEWLASLNIPKDTEFAFFGWSATSGNISQDATSGFYHGLADSTDIINVSVPEPTTMLLLGLGLLGVAGIRRKFKSSKS